MKQNNKECKYASQEIIPITDPETSSIKSLKMSLLPQCSLKLLKLMNTKECNKELTGIKEGTTTALFVR
jgi:hypothetical protein